MDRNEITIMVGTPAENAAGSPSRQVAKYGVGKKCRGRVVNFKPYGFFVETDSGEFGLVHGRNISGWNWSRRFDQVFRHGSEIEVTVVDVEAETNRLSFSCEMPPEEQEARPPEAEPEVKVDQAALRQELAQKWAEENPQASEAALAWLKAELSTGPLYGPLTNVLCDRFGVPVPASRWIRLFPEFTCYSGKGDNPKDLPAVALSERAGSVEYWNGIKVRTEDLSDGRRTDESEKLLPLGRLAKRLDEKGLFPSARWIADYGERQQGLVRGMGVYGVRDTVEHLVIPMLGQLGWDVSPDNAALVRGGGTSFDVCLYGGSASSGKVSVAVAAAPAGTGFANARGAVEAALGLYNRLGGDDPLSTKVVWTDGAEWVVFTRELLQKCIGVLADHRGDELQAERDELNFGCVTFEPKTTPFAWLSAFADLHDLLGA